MGDKKPQGIMKKKPQRRDEEDEERGEHKGGKTLFKDVKRQRSVDKGPMKDPRMSVISSSKGDSGVETRGLSTFSRAGGSWETDWNSAANVRDRGRSMAPIVPAAPGGGGGSLSGQGAAGPKGRPTGRHGSISVDSRFTMGGAPHTVQVDTAGRDSEAMDDTDPEELLRWTTAGRERDMKRQMMLDHRRKLHLDEYDPNLHREHLVLITDNEALAVTFNVFVGASFLGLPMAYLHSGLLMGTIGFCVVAVSVSYCMHLLIYWRYEISKQMRVSWLGYPRAMEFAMTRGPHWLAAVAPAFNVFIHVIFIPYLLFSTAIQCVFMAQALREILLYYDVHENIRTCIAVFFVPCVPLSMIPNMKIMAITSFVGVAASFMACLLLVIGILITQRDHVIGGNLVNVNLDTPLYLLVALSTLQPVAQLMCVESHMKTRENYLGYFGVLNRAIIVVTCVYLVLGSIAFSKFAEETKDNILDNLQMNELQVWSCIIFIFSVMLVFPVNVFTVYDFAWEVYLRKRLHGFPDLELTLWGYTVRIFVALFVIIITIIVVAFVNVKFYVMAVCLPLLIFVFPSAMEMSIGRNTPDLGVKSYKFWIDLIMVLMGIYIMVASIYATVMSHDQLVTYV